MLMQWFLCGVAVVFATLAAFFYLRWTSARDGWMACGGKLIEASKEIEGFQLRNHDLRRLMNESAGKLKAAEFELSETRSILDKVRREKALSDARGRAWYMDYFRTLQRLGAAERELHDIKIKTTSKTKKRAGK